MCGLDTTTCPGTSNSADEDSMDPITMIIAALTAGAVAGAQGTASDAVKDAYAGLRGLVKRLFSGKPIAEAALENHTEDPESKELLEKHLRAVNAGDDTALIEAAQKVLAAVDPDGTHSGKYVVNAENVQGFQAGNFNTQTNTWTTK
jgi:hypothetical protein